MSRFLRLCAFLSVLFFANNVMAAGYICPTDMKYTSCKSGYYLSECGTDKSNWTGQTVTGSYGNSCNKCPSGYNCNGGTKCPVSNSIACNPGYYLPAGATTCIKCGIAPDGTTKQGGYYCPGGSFDKTAGGGRNECPAIDGRVRTTHPEYFYANENMQITHITFPTWLDVNASITDCRVNYNVKNNRGTAHQEGVRYNSSTGKYDGAGGPTYYSKINAGYYGAVKYTSTYCNTTSNQMLYQNALPCPAGKYCEGYANGMPLCSSGTYNDTLGITGDISAGTYSAGGAKVQAPKSGSDCIGGSCGQCLEDHYCPEGTGSPISCPSPYKNSEIGATSIGGCYTSCLAGEAVFKPTESCTSSSTSPWYTTEDHNVYYGNKSPITYWPDYFSNVGTTINAHDAASDASMNVPAGTYAPGGGLDVRYVRIYSPTGITPLADIRLNGNVPNQIIGTISGNIGAVQDDDLNSLIVLLANAPASGNSHGSGYGAVFDFGFVYASANNIRFSLGNITAPRNIVIEVSADNVNWIVVFDQDVYGYDNQYTYYSVPTIVKLPKPASNCRAGTYQPGNLTVREFGASTGCVAVDAGYWNTGCGTSATGAVCSTDYFGGLITAGYYGGSGATTNTGSGKVNAGYYSTGGGTSATPTANGNGCVGSGKTCGLIAAGYYGGAGATTNTGSGMVNAGYYSTGGGTSATPTTNGNGCVGSGNTCGKVNAGYYSTGGGTSATPAANGNGCVGDGRKCGLVDAGCFGIDGSTSSCPSSCSTETNGYFRYSDAGSTSINDCYAKGDELSGKYVSYNEFLPCPVGSYNDALNEDGSQQRAYHGKPTQCHICPGGKVNVQPGATSLDQCGDSWCGIDISVSTIGYDWLTPTWNDVLAGQNLCVPTSCPKGYAYNTDAKTCNSCPQGHYQDVNGYKGATCTASAPGYYVKSTDQTKQTPCPAGEYTNTPQNSSCYKLSAGYWNNGCGTSNTGDVCSFDYSGGIIAAGYYGGSGATTNTGSGKVNAGYYSTGGGTSATPTANGNGCVGSGKTCGKVNAGYWNNGCGTDDAGSVCSADYSGGLIAAGYWGAAGATSNTGSGTVFAGHFSTGGATNNRPTANDCVGKKSDGTANTCGLVAAGYWTSHGSKTATPTNSETDCVNKLCGILDAGYYSTGGATRSTPTEIGNHCFGTACGHVDAGYYSTGGGTSATPTANGNGCVGDGKTCGLVDAGYYGGAGATSNTGSGKVNAGYYSTGGGTSATPTANGNGCVGDGKTCGTIAAGYYGGAGATTDTGSGTVFAGHFSTGGATNNRPTANDCVGKKSDGTANTCGLIAAGYWTSHGSKTATPTNSETDCVNKKCGILDAGYYSTGGATRSTPTEIGNHCFGTACGTVDPGYYSNGGGTSANGTCVSGKSCGPVAAGYYATGGATSNTGNGQVAGGYFATGGATKAEPSSSDCVGSGNTCGLISGGYWSVSGAKTATPTAKTDCIGMGNDNEYCGVISAGYYSTAGATYKYPATQGVDCVGDSACGKVKPGYYNNGCGINDAGSVCNTTKYEGGVVPAGYYTTGGSSMSAVAAGYYSTGGGTSATGSCLSGYKCGTVDGGYYSTGGGTSANGTCIGGKSCGLIDAGYYSTGGAKKANPYLSNSCVGKKSDGTANTCGLVNGGYYSTGGAINPTPTANGNGCVGSGKTCGKVSVAYYSNGGGTSANGTCIEGQVCGTCNSNYRGGTLTGKTTESQCQASCAAGKRVVEPYAACSEPAGAWFTPAHLVDYGHISPVNYCMDGYQLNNESHTGSVTSCARKLSDGQYMPSTQIAARYIKVTSGGSAQNSDTHMLEIQAFASNDGTGTNLLSGKGGNTGSKLTAATNGSWTRGAGESYAQGTDLIWDLGSVQKLGSLKFAMYTDGRVYRNLVIAVSENNQDYTTVFQDADFQTQNATEPTPDMVVLSALPKSCESGTVNPGKKVLLTQTSSCTACMGRTQFANTISQVCTTIEEGKYTTGCDANGNKCASAKWCDGAEYCVAGVRYDCPAPETNWTAGTGSGWTNVTQCNEYINAKNISTDCSSGQLVRNAVSATEWASEFTEKVAFKADPGAYIDRSGSLPTCTLCVVGSYSAGGTATACTACPAGKTNNSSNLSTCTGTCSNSAGVASDGWETTGWNTNNTVTNLCTIKSNGCSANNYKNNNACSTCSSATNSLYTLSAAGATSKNDCYLEPTATKYVASAGAGQVSCAKGGYCPGSTTANPIKIYFGGTHSSTHPTTGGRTQCPAGSYCTAGVSAATTCTTLGGGLYKNSDAGSDEQTDCHFTTTGGYYIDASTDTAEKECEANYYCEATKLNYPNTGSRASCPDPTVSTNVETISDVAWLSTACPDATTSNSSVQYAKWQTWSNTKLKSKSECPVLMYVDTPCATFQIQAARFNTTTGKYDADSSNVRIASVVKAGYYFTEPHTSTYCTTSPTALMYYKTAAKCPENSYCPGATVPRCNSGEHVYGEPFGKYACSSLGAFYTTSAAGAKTDTACYGTTTKTKYIAKANDATESVCAENGYCQGGVSVNYGSTGGRTACSGSYTLAASGSDDANDCYLKTTAGSYVKSAGAGQTTCPAGSWCVGNVVIYKGGSVSGRNTSGGSQQCPAGYQDGITGYSLESQCLMNVDGGHYVASAKESTASGTCQPGYAKIAHTVPYGETSSCDPCKNATYAKDPAQESCTACPTVSGASSYGYWNTNGKEGDHTVRDGCNATFKNPTLDDGTLTGYSCYIDTNADTYGKNGNGKGCWVNKSSLKCNGGYYNKKFNDNPSATQDIISPYATELIANVCRPVEENYYSPADSLTRTACASGLTTCGSGLCANEAGDCGRKLHAGDKVIHLRSEKRTTPTMVVNIGGTKFYGNLGAAIANSLRVKNGTNNYSVVNDNQ